MPDTVRSIESSAENLTIDGFEHVLEAEAAAPDSAYSALQKSEESVLNWWTIAETATNLGVKEKKVIRQIKRGALKAKHIKSDEGFKWKIKPEEAEATFSKSKSATRHLMITTLRKQIRDAEEKLRLKEVEIQAASYRIGYLEARSQAFEEQVLLLTTSKEAKKSGWSKFCNWMLGRSHG